MLDFALMQDVRLRLFEERDADELYQGVLRSCAAVGDRRQDHAVYSVLASEWARTSP
jgi:hypothetical protein